MKGRGLLIYMMGVLLVAGPEIFGFKEDVIPSYHHRTFDRDRIGQKLLKLEKEIAFGPVAKQDEDGEHWTLIKPKRDWKYSVKVKILTLKYSLKSMPNYRTHEEVHAYIRKETMKILNKYYNMEESDFHVNFEGRINMVGEKKVVAADRVYKKHGIVNPRPTFLRTIDELGDEIYVIECPPEWKDVYWEGLPLEDGGVRTGTSDGLVIFAPINFSKIPVELKVPLHKKIANPVLECIMAGCIIVLSIYISPVILVGLAKVSPLSGSIRYDQLTDILNVTDYGIVRGTDVTNNLETFFSGDGDGRVCFFPGGPGGQYNIDQYGSREFGGYDDHAGPALTADTTIVGEGDGTEFVALANALFMFYANSIDNVTMKDVKFTGTGVSPGGNLSSGAFANQNADNWHVLNVTSNGMINDGTGVNSRGISMVGTQVGSLIQDCRMDGNQQGIVCGAPDAIHGLRVVSCYSNDAVEQNYYLEGNNDGVTVISCVADGTGNGCYTYLGSTLNGYSVSGCIFLCDGHGMTPYHATAYTGYHSTWNANIAQTGANGIAPQCSLSIFTGNISTFNTSWGFYSFTRFSRNTIGGNVFAHNSGGGMYLQNTEENEHIGNQIIDNDDTRGVYFRTAGDNNRFINNKIYSSDTGTYHTTWGLDIEAGEHLYLRDNKLISAGATVCNDNVATTVWASGNQTEAWA